MPAHDISRPFVGAASKLDRTKQLARKMYTRFRLLDSDELASSSGDTPITVVCISDTHNSAMEALPAGDILVHAGDLSQYGTFPELRDQLCWLASVPGPFEHRVFIAGNHDLLLDSAFSAAHPDRELGRRPGEGRDDLLRAFAGDGGGLVYLEHEAVDLVVRGRRVRIFGSPWTPRGGSFAFQYDPPPSGPWTRPGVVPPDTDVLLVHGPPAAHLDGDGAPLGCPSLLREVRRARPRLVVCGHVHSARGEELLRWDWAQTAYEGAVLAGGWAGWRGWAWLIALALLVAWRTLAEGVRGLGGAAFKGGTGRVGPGAAVGTSTATRLVNAAVGSERETGKREAIVAII